MPDKPVEPEVAASVNPDAPEEDAKTKKAKKYDFHKKFTAAVILVLLLLTWSGQGAYYSSINTLNDSWVDYLFRWRGWKEGDIRVTMIAIDDVSIAKYGQYPWPRHIYQKLINNLFALGVQVVGLDILFPDPSDSKMEMRKGQAAKLIALGPNDQAIIDVTKSAGQRLVHALDLDSTDPKFKQTGDWAVRYPFEALKEVGTSFGLVQQPMVSDDSTVRRVPLMVGANSAWNTWERGESLVPSFGAKILSVFEGKPVEEYRRMAGQNIIRLNLRGEGEVMVETSPGEWGYEKRYGVYRIAAWRILEKELQVDSAKGKDDALRLQGMALVGSVAVGAFDHFASAFSGSTPGVETHATLIDNLLNNDYLREAPVGYTYALIVLFAGLAYWLVSLPALIAGLSFAGLLVAWAGATYILFVQNTVLPFLQPFLALFVTFGVLIIHKTMLEQQQKAEVRNMFGQYVAPEIVDILVKDPGQLRLGGQKKDMTIFFLDIAHFTTISEKMTPEALIKFLNRYLTALTDNILNSNGVVDKYIGDCIMAFWNAPLDVPMHREKACLAALDCVKTIQRLNDEYLDPTMPEKPAVRIGLNSGEVVVGNTGSARKLAYTVLGDEVNLSSRLEGANKFFGSTIMISGDTYEGAKRAVEARKLGSVRVVGKDIPIPVYELLAKKGELSKAWTEALPQYHAGISKYLKRDFKGAQAHFQYVGKLIPGDKPTKLYLGTCADYLVIPPPANWDGVFNLTSK